MKTITTETKVYKFEELPEKVQTEALDHYRNINTDHEWWEFTIDYWVEELAEYGFENADIAFSGSFSQGDGASFTATVNLDTLSNNMFYCAKRVDEARMWALINRAQDTIENPIIRRTQSHYSHENTCAFEYDPIFECYDTAIIHNRKIIGILDKLDPSVTLFNDEERILIKYSVSQQFKKKTSNNLETAWGFACDEIERSRYNLCLKIYNDLEKEYEYLTSDEAIVETFVANEYEFTANGRIY